MLVVSFSLVFLLVVLMITWFFFFQREHFLVVLLLLELISIVLVLGIPMTMFFFGTVSSPLFLVLLTMSACEASLGLSLMVYLVRSYGIDLLKSLSLGSL